MGGSGEVDLELDVRVRSFALRGEGLAVVQSDVEPHGQGMLHASCTTHAPLRM